MRFERDRRGEEGRHSTSDRNYRPRIRLFSGVLDRVEKETKTEPDRNTNRLSEVTALTDTLSDLTLMSKDTRKVMSKFCQDNARWLPKSAGKILEDEPTWSVPWDATAPEEAKRLRVKTEFKVRFPVPLDGSLDEWTLLTAWVIDGLDEDIVIGLRSLRRGNYAFYPTKGVLLWYGHRWKIHGNQLRKRGNRARVKEHTIVGQVGPERGNDHEAQARRAKGSSGNAWTIRTRKCTARPTTPWDACGSQF